MVSGVATSIKISNKKKIYEELLGGRRVVMVSLAGGGSGVIPPLVPPLLYSGAVKLSASLHQSCGQCQQLLHPDAAQ